MKKLLESIVNQKIRIREHIKLYLSQNQNFSLDVYALGSPCSGFLLIKMHIEKLLNPYSLSKGFENVLDCLPESDVLYVME